MGHCKHEKMERETTQEVQKVRGELTMKGLGKENNTALHTCEASNILYVALKLILLYF